MPRAHCSPVALFLRSPRLSAMSRWPAHECSSAACWPMETHPSPGPADCATANQSHLAGRGGPQLIPTYDPTLIDSTGIDNALTSIASRQLVIDTELSTSPSNWVADQEGPPCDAHWVRRESRAGQRTRRHAAQETRRQRAVGGTRTGQRSQNGGKVTGAPVWRPVSSLSRRGPHLESAAGPPPVR